MANVLIVAYLLIVLALIAVILLQRSKGGALGIGGGGGGLMTARGSANLLTRTTAILATLFFATAIGLTILSELDRGSSSILDRAATGADGQPTSVLDALNSLGGGSTDLPVPASDPVPPAGADPVTEEIVPTEPTAPEATTETPAPEAAAPESAAPTDLPVPDAPAETPVAPTN